MMRTKSNILFVFLLCLSSPVKAMELASFRAVYDLQPARIDQGSKSQPIDGKLAYEVSGADCAGWTVTSQYLNRSSQAEQGLRTAQIKSRSFETPNGLSISVSQQQSVDDKLVDDQQIKARRQSAGAVINGSVTGSKTLNFQLAAGVLYPTQHQKKLLELAQQGITRDVSTIFDGSDGAKLFRIITFIGKKRPPTEQLKPELAPLSKLASWPFQLGYYSNDDDQTDAPEFQISFNMFENGISTEMLFDYGSYALKSQISRLEMMAAAPCISSEEQPQ